MEPPVSHDKRVARAAPTPVTRDAATQAAIDRASDELRNKCYTDAGTAYDAVFARHVARDFASKSIALEDVPALLRQTLTDFIMLQEHNRRLTACWTNRLACVDKDNAKKRQEVIKTLIDAIVAERATLNSIKLPHVDMSMQHHYY